MGERETTKSSRHPTTLCVSLLTREEHERFETEKHHERQIRERPVADADPVADAADHRERNARGFECECPDEVNADQIAQDAVRVRRRADVFGHVFGERLQVDATQRQAVQVAVLGRIRDVLGQETNQRLARDRDQPSRRPQLVRAKHNRRHDILLGVFTQIERTFLEFLQLDTQRQYINAMESALQSHQEKRTSQDTKTNKQIAPNRPWSAFLLAKCTPSCRGRSPKSPIPSNCPMPPSYKKENESTRVYC